MRHTGQGCPAALHVLPVPLLVADDRTTEGMHDMRMTKGRRGGTAMVRPLLLARPFPASRAADHEE